MSKLKNFLNKHPKLKKVAFAFYNSFNLKNKLKVGKGNKKRFSSCILKGLKLKIKGKNNLIIIEENANLKNCLIEIVGDNNLVHIHKNCTLRQTRFALQDNGNSIELGEKTFIYGKTSFSAIEGTKITVGENCLFSEEIDFRTGDSHGILNSNGERINPSKDITIGNHVWFGIRTLVLKGSLIANDCIVGASSVVNKPFESSNCIIAGQPAKVVKTQVNWSHER